MIEYILPFLIYLLCWADASTTYLFLKKAKDYGYPNWLREETSPVYKHLIKKYGLEVGIIIAAILNPTVISTLAILINKLLSISIDPGLSLGLSFGTFYGMLILTAQRNYSLGSNCSASTFNEKIVGKPLGKRRKNLKRK